MILVKIRARKLQTFPMSLTSAFNFLQENACFKYYSIELKVQKSKLTRGNKIE
jgi:hypothetical protein